MKAWKRKVIENIEKLEKKWKGSSNEIYEDILWRENMKYNPKHIIYDNAIEKGPLYEICMKLESFANENINNK